MSQSNKIKVLHVVHRMTHGGIETFLMSMLRKYDRNRFHMDILYTGPDEGEYADQVRQLGAKLLPCKLGAEQIRFMYKFCRILREGKYEAVNSHLSDMGGGAILAAKLVNIPARVASYHTNWLKRIGIKKLYMETMRKLIVKTATDITTSSPDVAASHFTRVSVPDEKIHPISYGVDTVYFGQSDVKPLDICRFGFLRDDPVIGHVGHYTLQKNHTTLIKIADRVIKQIPNARFLLCGTGGTLKANVEKEISNMGLLKHFAMIQGLDDIRQFYASIDVFILPSRHEGMPVSIIEAQAAGKPVVASRLNGIEIATAEEMKKNLFAVDDVEPFARCVIELLKNKNKRIALGKIGRNYVQKNLDIKIAVKKYEKLYLPKELR